MRNNKTSFIAKVAILGAIAFILMFFDFPLPFFPSFYKFDFSEVAVLVGGFALGWKAAISIEAVKILLSILFKGTSTAYVGELASFLTGLALTLPPVILYQKNKTRKDAVRGLAVGIVVFMGVGLLLNYFVLLPSYSYFFHLPMDALTGMGSAIIPFIKDRLTFVLFATTPFNLLKGFVVSLVTIALYKHISPLLHR
ncbi:MAG: ECF transporter S component [Solobacterium sp.]|nr:ECF transporter S component [Solobacterium sp.]